MKKKHPGGRPLKFKSPEELEKKIRAYFKSCWEQKLDMFGNPIFVKDKRGRKTDTKVMKQARPYTLSGLAVYLDCDRELLSDWGKDRRKDKFYRTIKRSRDVIQGYSEDFLYSGKNPTGAIFGLKNNWGWKDKTETDVTSGGKRLKMTVVSYEKVKSNG